MRQTYAAFHCQPILLRVALAGIAVVARGGFISKCAAEGVSVVEVDGAVEVRHDGQLFTRYVYADTPKPILYPIVGPHGISMTRNYPMRTGVAGEATDHPHHRSLWFAHGRVNGVDFWLEGPGKGKIVHDRLGQIESTSNSTDAAAAATITAFANWIAPGGAIVCRESRKMRFSVAAGRRSIELRITLHASEGPIVFGDTKEGTMALRVRPELRRSADPRRGGLHQVSGRSVSSEGLHDNAIWGQAARWIDYFAEVEGKRIGVAVCDHPSNPRHPTRWHARDYGLLTANPFALHDFAGRPRGEGKLEVAQGKTVSFRYLCLFHQGDPQEAGIEQLYQRWAQSN